MHRNEIRIGNPEARGQRLRIPVSAKGLPKRLLTDSLEVDYDYSIEEVPDSILILPAVGNLLPVAWASDSRLTVPEIDSRFDAAVDDIRAEFNQLYPELASERILDATKKRDVDCIGEHSMMLFSGGVDSLTTYVRHRDERPHLVSIHGADMALDNQSGWGTIQQSLQEFADRERAELFSIQSNFREMLEYPLLQSYYGSELAADWWGSVQHGLALLTHCAPIAYTQSVSDLYIGATHTDEFSPAWGSCPELDNAVEYAGTTVSHDGYSLTRQEKIKRITEYIQDTGEDLLIRSCYESEAGDNCGTCEKCCRTIVGLEIAGVDPMNHGYPIEENTFSYIRTSLQQGNWNIGKDEEYMWSDLHLHLPAESPPHDGARRFFGWFADQDVSEFYDAAQSSSSITDLATPYLRYLPDVGYRALTAAKHRAE